MKGEVKDEGLEGFQTSPGLAGCCVGPNQINVRVPAGVSRANAVSVVLNINGKVSNTVTIVVQ